MLRVFLIGAVLALSGCLTTAKPVLTPENSITPPESETFIAFVAAWEAWGGTEDSPRIMLDDEDIRILEIDGQMLIQEVKANDKVEYYALGLMGARPMACYAHDAEMKPIAERHGVTLTIARNKDSDEIMPVPVHAMGPDAALHDFVLEVFTSGTSTCFSPPRQQG